MILSVVLADDFDNFEEIQFSILDTPIAKRWANEIKAGYNLYETERFKGWPNRDINFYKTQINKHISIVNSYKENSISVIENLTQENLNFLHKFFEDLRGSIEVGTEFYNAAPLIVKESIDRFNILIHEAEHCMRDSYNPTIVVTFKDRPRHPLQDTDFNFFTFKWEFGTVYINYCEVGKPLLDVFKDNDQFVGKDNVRPLLYYSADFMIKFGPSVPDLYYTERLNQFYKWYDIQDFNFDKSKLSLGLIPVAKILNFESLSETQIINKLTPYKRINSVCIK